MRFTIDETDWNELMRLSKEASNTPVMALSVGDGLAGRDFASMARERVFEKWREVGRKMGFDASEVQPVDQNKRLIEARAVNVSEPLK